MLKIINKYKLGIIGFSIVLSGCSTTDYLKFKAECAKLPDNYINNSLTPEYEKENSFYAIEYKQDACAYSPHCTLLQKKEEWDFVEIYLKSDSELFPPVSGYYKIYRDFTFNNCIKNYSGFNKNSFNNKNGNFCMAANKIEFPKSKLIYKHTENNSSLSKNISFITIEAFLDKKKYISIKNARFSSPSVSEKCNKSNGFYNAFLNKFN